MPRRWHQVGTSTTADDGDKKARSPGRMRNKPLKPFARGMPGETGVTCGGLTRVLFCSAREAAGASIARHSLRPLFWGKDPRTWARFASRERESVDESHTRCLKSESAPNSLVVLARTRERPQMESCGARREIAELWQQGVLKLDNAAIELLHEMTHVNFLVTSFIYAPPTISPAYGRFGCRLVLCGSRICCV
jgi:hypothetical protein